MYKTSVQVVSHSLLTDTEYLHSFTLAEDIVPLSLSRERVLLYRICILPYFLIYLEMFSNCWHDSSLHMPSIRPMPDNGIGISASPSLEIKTPLSSFEFERFEHKSGKSKWTGSATASFHAAPWHLPPCFSGVFLTSGISHERDSPPSLSCKRMFSTNQQFNLQFLSQICSCSHLCPWSPSARLTALSPCFPLPRLLSGNGRTAGAAQRRQWDDAALPPGSLPPSDRSPGEVLQRPGPPQGHRRLPEPNRCPRLNRSCLLRREGSPRPRRRL